MPRLQMNQRRSLLLGQTPSDLSAKCMASRRIVAPQAKATSDDDKKRSSKAQRKQNVQEKKQTVLGKLPLRSNSY
jgi:hypothetical protein